MVEGNKTIRELANSQYKIKDIYTTHPEDLDFKDELITEIAYNDLKKISQLKTPKDSVAVCEIPESIVLNDIPRQLVLDGIQDPGNLGTIVRLADWFGIEQIICSEDTVDIYNPKVIQASMGSFTRVNVVYTQLTDFLKNCNTPILGTDMEGENIYQFNFPESFLLVLGNEGNGIRPRVEGLLNDKITIPRFGTNQSTESLNVSIATAIVLGEIFSKV